MYQNALTPVTKISCNCEWKQTLSGRQYSWYNLYNTK